MSDADSPKHDPGSISLDRYALSPDPAQSDAAAAPQPDAHLALSGGSLSGEPSASVASADPLLVDVDGWQTVDFPGALRVDEIPCGESDIPVMAVTSYAGLMQQLQQENAQMRDRIIHLEDALALSQLSARTEILHQGDTHASPPDPIVGFEREAERSTAEADLAAASDQRHQILVETLNAQLQSSQERIAQLEQECILTQQRLNEKMQQCLQAETTCRDLRTRLHRQQQQALQFKTALEKCLEVPAQSAAPADVAPPPEPVFPMATPDGAIPLFVSKTSPVRPWSSQDDSIAVDGAGTETDLPKLSKLMSPEQMPEVRTPSPASSPAELLDLEFVNRVFPSSTAHEAVEPVHPDDAHIFDIRPFLDAAPESESTSAATEPSAPALPAPDNAGGDALWDQLAQLIHPAAIPDRATLETALAIAQTGDSAADDVATPAATPADLSDLLTETASREVTPAEAASLAATSEEEAVVDPESESPQPALFDGAGPSPLLYPLRPTKKLKSLAAVELPTFPRS